MHAAPAAMLDETFLSFVRGFAAGENVCDDEAFNRHALACFAYQREKNAAYARFAGARLPASWQEIPAVPASAFKDATLAAFDVRTAELAFHTSGTTATRAGWHYFERAALYDRALLAGFDRSMLADGARLRYLNLVPDPRFKTHSSLGYMLGHVSVLRGDGHAGWFLSDDGVDTAGLSQALRGAIAQGQPVCIAGTAFAFVALLDALSARGESFVAPARSRILETGGFKGRTRALSREELYASLTARFGIPADSIVAEYGMTELTTQYYDALDGRHETVRVKTAPPWLRTLVVDGDGREVRAGETGFLRHVDLGNRASVIAVQTEDRGYARGSGIVLLGRDSSAEARGCSLDAEDLLSRSL